MTGPVRDLSWLVLLVILSRSVTALLVRHNSSARLNYSDVLQRVSSAKAILDAGEAEGHGKDQAQGKDHAQVQ